MNNRGSIWLHVRWRILLKDKMVSCTPLVECFALSLDVHFSQNFAKFSSSSSTNWTKQKALSSNILPCLRVIARVFWGRACANIWEFYMVKMFKKSNMWILVWVTRLTFLSMCCLRRGNMNICWGIRSGKFWEFLCSWPMKKIMLAAMKIIN